MTLSDKVKNLKFTKSVGGYTTREVDAFLAEILPLLREEEQVLSALRAKLSAFEGKGEEIRQKEQETYRLLEAAKEEAQIIVATAKKEAADIASAARIEAEVQQRSAASHASETISKAEAKAQARMDEANAVAEKIIATADARGRELLAKVKAVCDEEERKAKALANECADFETRFRTIVADTARALAKIKEESPVPYEEAVKPTEPLKAEPPKEKEPEVTEPKEEPLVETEVDIGTLVFPKANTRKLYDMVDVTYENEEDDFSEIRDIMKGKGAKSPTHFSE
ncbi:MAG: DivIVA domain-containing protein [Ruminococcaceae bacterium]|nr:DivIVA domain-containing protein [Oscillospiraceae bacterium]